MLMPPRLRHPVLLPAVSLVLLAVSPGIALAATVAEARPTVSAATAVQPQLDRGRLFDTVVETIAKNFVDEDKLKAVDWASRAAAVRPVVMTAPSSGEAIQLIKSLLGELKTSHTALYTPDDLEYSILLDVVPPRSDPDKLMDRKFWGSRSHYAGIGAFTREIDGRHFIDGIMEGSPADRAGLKYGDEIVNVDGRPYAQIAAFRGKVGQTVELQIRRAAGADPLVVRVDVLNLNPSDAFAAATRASARVIERNGKRIGYIHLWSIREDEPAKDALGSLRGGETNRWHRHGPSEGSSKKPLDFLIVDARGKVGGSGSAAQSILEAIARPAGDVLGNLRFANRGQAIRKDKGHENPFDPGFAGRSILLIDDHTRSAGELLADGYKNSKLGTLIGTPTAGAVMGGATYVMPGDLLLYVAVSKVEIEGQSLEGKGVAPDERVERLLPYANGADPILEAAITKLAGPAK